MFCHLNMYTGLSIVYDADLTSKGRSLGVHPPSVFFSDIISIFQSQFPEFSQETRLGDTDKGAQLPEGLRGIYIRGCF